MNSIDFRQANELLNLDLVDLESCFDPLFYPPEAFENTSDNQRGENSPFACMGKYKIGNTLKEQWDRAQELRQCRRRPAKAERQGNLYRPL